MTPRPTPYAAVFEFNWLSAAGTACFMASVLTALILRVPPRQFAQHLHGRPSSSWRCRW